jgi:hypothetical protein
LVWANKVLFLSDTVYYNSFADQLTYEQIEEFIARGRKWEWLGYVLVPVIYLIKFTLVALVLGMGLWFATDRFDFTSLFKAAVLAEFVFLVPMLLKIGWFLVFQTDYTLQDLQFFYPFSALSLFEYSAVEPWLIYPLQLLNIFELCYLIVLAYQVAPLLPKPKGEQIEEEAGFFERSGRGLGVVLPSYGTGLVVWVAIVMFITLSYS